MRDVELQYMNLEKSVYLIGINLSTCVIISCWTYPVNVFI